MSFDPSTIAVVLSALIARCDYQQFTMTTSAPAAPTLISGQRSLSLLGSSEKHPFQDYFKPVSQSVVTITWTAVYHGQTYSRQPLIADASKQAMAQAAVLQDATDFLNLIDLRASRDGANPNTYSPLVIPERIVTPGPLTLVLTPTVIPGYAPTGLWGTSNNDLWAIANDPATFTTTNFLHYDGKSWTSKLILSNFIGVSIWGTASNNIYVVGYDSTFSIGTVYVWNGLTWSVLGGLPTNVSWVNIAGSGPNDIWLAGSNSTFTTGVLYHWNGSIWTNMSLTFVPETVSAPSPTYAIVVGADSTSTNGFYITWNGTTWSSPSEVPGLGLSGVLALSPTIVFATPEAAGTDGIYQFNGTTWSLVAAASIAMDQLSGTPSQLWAVGGTGAGQGAVFYFTNGVWAQLANRSDGTMFTVWSNPPGALAGGNLWIGGIDNTQTNGILWQGTPGPSA